MIGKVTMGSGAAGVISYCYLDDKNAYKQLGKDAGSEIVERGELLYSNEVWQARLANGQLNVAAMAAQFHDVATLNAATTKFLWHQTFSFKPGDTVSNETMVKIARDFAKEFGFEHNQYMVFRHRDTAHEHFHIIANRINVNGENTATDKHNYERIQVFSRKMEQKYGLAPVENHRQKVDVKHNLENRHLDRLRKLLDTTLPKHASLSELSIALRKQGITMNVSRGVSFTDQRTGITYKGSDLGKEYSRKGIEERLGKGKTATSGEEKKVFDGYQRQIMRDTIDKVLLQTTPCHPAGGKASRLASLEASWRDFGNRLGKEGIALRLVRDEVTGAIKGAAFQIGERRYVNGQELGELYTVRSLAMQFGRSPQEYEDLLQAAKQTVLLKQTPSDKGLEFVKEEAGEGRTKMVAGPNAASETNQDLAKIAEAQRSVDTKKNRRRIK